MRLPGLHFLLVAALSTVALAAASNPFAGTWNLNNSKSKFSPGTEIKEMKIVFTANGNQVKRVTTGVDVDGEPIAEISILAWDGSEHALDAAPGTTAAVTPGKRMFDVTVKREGKVVEQMHATASRNGKTMTIIDKGVDAKGRPVDNIEIFEKQ